MPLNGNRDLSVDPKHDRIIEAFASCRRRCVMYHFLSRNQPASDVSELRDFILDADPAASDGEAVTTDLFHRTLPKLDAAGLVDFDVRSETVRFHGLGKWEPVLRAIHRLES